MRAIKTGIGVALAIWIGEMLHLTTPMYAGFAAVVSIQSTVYDSWLTGFYRLLSTFIGAIIAVLFHQLGFRNPVAIAIGIILLIYICVNLKLTKSIVLSCMIFIVVILYDDSTGLLLYTYNRLLDTSVGLIIGIMINSLISPPDIKQDILKDYEVALSDILKRFRIVLESSKRIDMEQIMLDVNKINSDYELMRKEESLAFKKEAAMQTIVDINRYFTRIYSLLNGLSAVSERPVLREKTKQQINELYQEPLDYEESPSTDDYRIVYNYYVKKIVDLILLTKQDVAELYRTEEQLLLDHPIEKE